MGLLAREVLAEIPKQLTTFMKKWDIVPRSPDNPFPKDVEAANAFTIKSIVISFANRYVTVLMADVFQYTNRHFHLHYRLKLRFIPILTKLAKLEELLVMNIKARLPYPETGPTDHVIFQQSVPSAPTAPPIDVTEVEPQFRTAWKLDS
ncbi:hypothetical protein DICVIV_09124 [Dictyocaulus viviparus]|uniref:Uncharacterized protein n=1 Tax=Dictyocaulus viviparus TaxID=29172 RepID=A0A0D8XR62_DICVI|nr:hypothetical protein DICVIV_09124 [Dictyocaulus viviparus]